MITEYLQSWREGDPNALPNLVTAIHSELRRVAAGIVKSGCDGQTLQPTALVNELYLKLPGLQSVDWKSRAQFLNIAAAVMRRVLVDYCRQKNALKRGGATLKIALGEHGAQEPPEMQIDVLLVHELLDRFSADFPRQAKIVELRFFGGLTEEETTQVLGETGISSSARTVARDWAFARAWLRKEMSAREGVSPDPR